MTEEAWNVRKILDHGFVHLIDSMPSWEQQDFSGLCRADARIVQAARVSTGHLPSSIAGTADAEVRSTAQDVKLIDYLMKNAHTSPFEKVRFEFVVSLPIFVARQWIRHRCGSFNETSARYAQLPERYYVPEPSRMRVQAKTNKQASGDRLPHSYALDCIEEIESVSKHAYNSYVRMLDRGLARELARMVLPLNYYTTWYWTVDAHNLFHFLKLRLAENSQYEIRVYAEAILEMVEHVAPVATAAFRKYMLGHSPQRALHAEGKIAKLIEWAKQKQELGHQVTAAEVLLTLEAVDTQ